MTMTTMTMLVLLQLHCPLLPPPTSGIYSKLVYVCVRFGLGGKAWQRNRSQRRGTGYERDYCENCAASNDALRVCRSLGVCIVCVCVCAFVLAKIVARKIELQLQQRQGGGGVRGGRETGTAMTRT